jgi:anti-anti-sigma factor
LLASPDFITTAVKYRGDVAVLAVAGEVDNLTASALEDAIDRVVRDGLTTLIIDLSEVTFLASIGLAILASTHDRLDEGAGFAVVADGAATSRPIQLTGLDQCFSLHSTLDEALASVHTEIS